MRRHEREALEIERRMAEARRQAREAREQWEHVLYRCYDKEGRLLYIGCTSDIGSRMAIHESSWNNPASAYLNLHMDRYEVSEPIVGRSAARKAEREAIAAEAPLLNVHHNKGRGLPREPVPPITQEDMRLASEAIEKFLGLGGVA